MKKTKFKVEPLSWGNHSEGIMRMIGNHNGGNALLTLEDIKGYVNSMKARYPNITEGKGAVITDPENEKRILISDDNGATVYLAITEIELHELTETEIDLQLQNHLS